MSAKVLNASTVTNRAIAGSRTICGAVTRRDRPRLDHAAPRRSRRLDAQSEEAQGPFEHKDSSGGGEGICRKRGNDIRENLSNRDAHVPRAAPLGSKDELSLSDADRARACQPDERRRQEDRDGHDQVARRWTQQSGNDQQEDESGNANVTSATAVTRMSIFPRR